MLALPEPGPAATVVALDRSSMLAAVPASRNTISWLPPLSSRCVLLIVMLLSLPPFTVSVPPPSATVFDQPCRICSTRCEHSLPL